MGTSNVKAPVQSGDTFIAYIDDCTCFIGVALERDDAGTWKTLVLGYFEDKRPRSEDGVFAHPYSYTFPGYQAIKEKCVASYDFEMEIALCKARDSAWWKSSDAPCYTNLVAKHFRPRALKELQYIDATRQILQGKTFEEFKSFGQLPQQTFLKLWAVLYCHFPERVAKPAEEYTVRGSNIRYRVKVDCVPPTVSMEIIPAA